MKTISALAFTSIAVLSILLSSCKNTMTPGLDQVTFPNTGQVSYGTVQQLFSVGCNYVGCHNHEDQAGGLDLTYYDSWLTDPHGSIIISKDTTGSRLVQYIEGKAYHDPALPSALTPNQIQGLKRWIMQGAGSN
jgi:Planctomycete cytochrome C